MAKDLTEALRALTEPSAGLTSRRDKSLLERQNPPGIQARTGSAGPVYGEGAGGTGFELYPEKTMTTSDGLFTIYYPKTIKARVSGSIGGEYITKIVTVGVIKEEAPDG